MNRPARVPHEAGRHRNREHASERSGIHMWDMGGEHSRSTGTKCQHCCDPSTNVDTEHRSFALASASDSALYAAAVPTKFRNSSANAPRQVETRACRPAQGRMPDCTVCNARRRPRVICVSALGSIRCPTRAERAHVSAQLCATVQCKRVERDHDERVVDRPVRKQRFDFGLRPQRDLDVFARIQQESALGHTALGQERM
jgi:hypothetical protein